MSNINSRLSGMTLALVLMLLPLVSHSADQAFEIATTTSGNEAPRYRDNLYFTVTLKAVKAIDVKEVCVSLPRLLRPFYELNADGEECWSQDLSMATGESKSIEIPIKPRSSLARGDALSAVSLKAQSWSINTSVELAGGKKIDSFTAVDFHAAQYSVFFGGVVGSLLLAVFINLPRAKGWAPFQAMQADGSLTAWIKRVPGSVIQILQQVGNFCTSVASQAVYFSITTLILVLMANITEGLDSPAAVVVQDFWGGIVAALFSVPVSEWLHEKLSSKKAAPLAG